MTANDRQVLCEARRLPFEALGDAFAARLDTDEARIELEDMRRRKYYRDKFLMDAE